LTLAALDHFSLIAPYYDRIFGRSSIGPLLGHVAPAFHHRLLDVGGGTGRVALCFQERVAQVCVLDPSPRMLAETRQKGICIVQGQSEELPFPDASFDRIIMVDVFHHLLDQQRSARELLRVLSRAGRLVIEEPDVRRRPVKLVALGEKILLMRSHFWAPGDIIRLFERLGVRAKCETCGHTAWVIVQK
jgi:demethylmenaquinone methyltransferase/2-methoxy-6-polyprenyl-1,4-benzoquinol methylase